MVYQKIIEAIYKTFFRTNINQDDPDSEGNPQPGTITANAWVTLYYY